MIKRIFNIFLSGKYNKESVAENDSCKKEICNDNNIFEHYIESDPGNKKSRNACIEVNGSDVLVDYFKTILDEKIAYFINDHSWNEIAISSLNSNKELSNFLVFFNGREIRLYRNDEPTKYYLNILENNYEVYFFNNDIMLINSFRLHLFKEKEPLFSNELLPVEIRKVISISDEIAKCFHSNDPCADKVRCVLDDYDINETQAAFLFEKTFRFFILILSGIVEKNSKINLFLFEQGGGSQNLSEINSSSFVEESGKETPKSSKLIDSSLSDEGEANKAGELKKLLFVLGDILKVKSEDEIKIKIEESEKKVKVLKNKLIVKLSMTLVEVKKDKARQEELEKEKLRKAEIKRQQEIDADLKKKEVKRSLEKIKKEEEAKKKEHENKLVIGREIRKIIEQHANALLRKRLQLVVYDDYGIPSYYKWEQEVSYFFKNVLEPGVRRLDFISHSDRFDAMRAVLGEVYVRNYGNSGKLVLSEGFVNYFDSVLNELSSEEKHGKKIDLSSPLLYEVSCCESIINAGWSASLTKASGDQGVDIIAWDNFKKFKVVFQCKLYFSGSVGNSAVQQVFSGMAIEGANAAVVVSNAPYTKSAREAASASGIALIHHDDLEFHLSLYKDHVLE